MVGPDIIGTCPRTNLLPNSQANGVIYGGRTGSVISTWASGKSETIA
ncbi:MAG: hypothetical protein QG628_124 [Patescibacteria group bacterium]|nr:hypothetical protein [Patescibacteria group bacterium]